MSDVNKNHSNTKPVAVVTTDDMAMRMMGAFRQRGVHNVPDMDEDPRVVIGMMDMAVNDGVSMASVAKGLCPGCNHR